VTRPPFQRLLDEHAVGVHRYLIAAAGPNDAADCFQETMLAALRSYPTLRNATNLAGWLYTIARNKALDAHRARARRPVPVGAVLDEAMTFDDLDPAHPVWEVVRTLPERQRDTVLLRYVGDLSYAEIGRMLGISEEAARQHASTGVRRLRTGDWDGNDRGTA
jgi:RNA polymerase sigma factor (sigma-70 family)